MLTCWRAQKVTKYLCDSAGGAIYTVDEVSDLLGIPRPTLYRYLREYSIPHLRRSGRISIPEDSFGRIREARDLHKEGLGTESVRRQLREGRRPDTAALDRRLDLLHETLEDLRERPTTDEVALSPAVRTILARQSLLISAMFNLTGMVEDLLLASGKPRKPLFEDLEAGPQGPSSATPARERLAIPVAATAASVSAAVPEAARDAGSAALPALSGRFGVLRRRRRGVLVILLALLLGLCLVLAFPALIGADDPGPSASRAPRPAGEPSGKIPSRAEGAKAAPGETTSPEETTTRASSAEGNTKVAAAGSKPEAEVRVPDVSNLGLEEASGVITDAGLDVAVFQTEASQTEPVTVIGTAPAAGTLADQGDPVTLRISVGANASPPSVPAASSSVSAQYPN